MVRLYVVTRETGREIGNRTGVVAMNRVGDDGAFFGNLVVLDVALAAHQAGGWSGGPGPFILVAEDTIAGNGIGVLMMERCGRTGVTGGTLHRGAISAVGDSILDCGRGAGVTGGAGLVQGQALLGCTDNMADGA